MATNPINDGQVDDIVSHYPASAIRIAKRGMERANLPTDNPEDVMTFVASSEFKNAAAEAIDSRGDSNAVQGFLGSEMQIPETGSVAERQMGLFDAREDTLRGEARSANAFRIQKFKALERYNKLAEFDSTAHKTKRLKEIDPTSAYDDQIMKLRFRQMKEVADIRSSKKLAHLSPAARERIIANNRKVTLETMNDLKDMRSARLTAAEARVDEEIASKNRTISQAQTRVANIDAQLEVIEGKGDDFEAKFNLNKEKLKLEALLAKEKGKGGEAQWEVIYELLKSERAKRGFKITPDQERTMEALAKDIARGKEARGEEIMSTGDNFRGITGESPRFITDAIDQFQEAVENEEDIRPETGAFQSRQIRLR